MLFFDPIFLALFLVVFPLNFVLRGHARLIMLLIASYVFYAWWDWRFVTLLLLSTGIDFFVGNALQATVDQRKRRWLLAVSVVANLSILGFFKYFNFFVDSFAVTFSIPEDQRFFWSIILPPGISFYTFQTMSYTIDVFRRKAPAERDPVLFATFVAFFPQLIAGPIERPNKLIPQLRWQPRFSYANLYFGLRLFVAGCFKKLVIADHVSKIADAAFADPAGHSTLGLWIGAYCFAIQIYCDFSGYADMARGIAKTMGIDLSRNFNLPYLSSSLNEFWRRWHITLSYWLRDYVYIPLGGSRNGFAHHVRNLFITFSLSGLWHGAAWSFVLWGVLHAGWIVGELVLGRLVRWRPPRWAAILITFHVVVLLWVLFRAQSLTAALDVYAGLLPIGRPLSNAVDAVATAKLLVYSAPLVLFSIWQYRTGREMPDMTWRARPMHGAALGGAAFFTILLGAQDASQFIYFQF